MSIEVGGIAVIYISIEPPYSRAIRPERELASESAQNQKIRA